MSDPVVHITAGIPDSGTGNITTLGQTLVDGANATMGITTGAAVTTSAAGTLQQYLRGLVSLFSTVTIKAVNTAPVTATDPALVTVLRPDSAGIIATGTAGSASATVLTVQGVASMTALKTDASATTQPVSGTVSITDISNAEYETVAASQTAQILGGAGATGDYISGLLVIPATPSPGNVLLLDNATSITVFAGGATSVSNLVPFFVPLGMKSVSGAWKVTTGSNVSVIGIGNFT